MAAPAVNTSTLAARLSSASSAANAIRGARDRLQDLQTRLQSTAPEQIRAIAGEVLAEVRPSLYHAYESLVLSSAAPIDAAAILPEQLLDAVAARRPGRDAGADEHLRFAVSEVRVVLRDLEHAIRCAAAPSGPRPRKRARKLDRALTFLGSACVLAVEHADLAVAFLAGFWTQARQELPAGRRLVSSAAALAAAKRAATAINAERGRVLELQTAPSHVARALIRGLRPGLELGHRDLLACLALPSAGLSLDVDQLDQLHGDFDALIAWRPSPTADAGEHLCLAITALRLLLDRCSMLLDRGSGMEMEKARVCLDRVGILARLAVAHTDLVVAFLCGSKACVRSQAAPLPPSSS